MRRFRPACDFLEPRLALTSVATAPATAHHADQIAYRQATQATKQFEVVMNELYAHSHATMAEYEALASGESPGFQAASLAHFENPTQAAPLIADIEGFDEGIDLSLTLGWLSNQQWQSSQLEASLAAQATDLGFTSAQTNAFINADRAFAVSIGATKSEDARLQSCLATYGNAAQVLATNGDALSVQSGPYAYFDRHITRFVHR